MLTTPERIVYIALVLICGWVGYRGFSRIVRVVRRGKALPRSDRLAHRFITALIDVFLQKPIFKARPFVSLLHAFLFFGFSFYVLVNINDLLEAYVPGWTTFHRGPIANAFNLVADIFSALVLIGMVALLYRRFAKKPKALNFNPSVKLHAGVTAGGVRRDSLIVGLFIILHVGGRWMGTAFHLAEHGQESPWLPTASLIAPSFAAMSPASLEVAIHVCWWLAMGLIVLFITYFPYSKHLHLIVAPVNIALGRAGARGEMDAVADPAQPGAEKLTDLYWPLILDSFACIQCNRCQEVCPAHHSGTPLSPAALEINKRYYLNEHASDELADRAGRPGILDFATSVDAVWSCTTCYACVRVCPVGNEPMVDLLEMRRRMVFNGQVPDALSDVFRNLDEKGNSFGESPRKRARWTKDLGFEIPDARKQAVKYLWFVGDFASYNPQCQQISRTVAKILHAAGVDFGLLYEGERSAGNDIRRTGEEGLFETLADHNVRLLGECEYETIFTTDPHTLNALNNDYKKFGVNHQAVHYTTLLAELIESGAIELKKQLGGRATYHDPCYLGRYNRGFDAPRGLIRACGIEVVEMPRNRENSFCCGAGGGRIWMPDHDDVTERPSENRIREALSLGAIDYFVVACPKDLTMYSDAVKTSGNEGNLQVRDVADFVAEAMVLEIEAEAA